ncbi:MFS general substrate transporter [Schizophyllum commune H4-8]|nr:MFS general substrate transporter [Schizophyllum commune H4-8]KAI5895711.1 MFS general substrate transporter [Schizophyllum commune H4-8]
MSAHDSSEKVDEKDAGALASAHSATLSDHEAEYEEYLALKAHYDTDPAAHRRLLRKLDIRILPFLSLLYLLCSLDKANAGNAKLFGFLEEVPMTGTQFNLGLTVFFFTYGACELPSNIMLRRLGPRVWFPIIICLWGTVSTLTSVINNYGSFIAIRLALGCSEAGMYPGAYFILSTWYLPHELQTRMAIFYGANTAAGAFGGVIAYGIGNLDGHHGWRAWRWLFLIEGVITVAAGIVGLYVLPDFPYAFKQKWLKPEEARFITLRSKYHAGPNPPDLRFKWSDVRAALKDWKTYTIMSMFWWGGSVPTYSLSYTLPTMVASLGYSNIKAQALTTPPYVFATIVTVCVGLWSDRYKSRMKAIMFSYCLGLTGIIILMVTVHYSHLYGVSYFAIFLAAAGYSAQAPGIGAWISNNVVSPTKRAASIGFMMAWGSVGGGGIGSNIYIAEQAPTYPLGFGFSIGATVLGAMIPCMINWYLLRRENRRRDAMDPAVIKETYTEEQLSEMGEDSPLFRFTL